LTLKGLAEMIRGVVEAFAPFEGFFVDDPIPSICSSILSAGSEVRLSRDRFGVVVVEVDVELEVEVVDVAAGAGAGVGAGVDAGVDEEEVFGSVCDFLSFGSAVPVVPVVDVVDVVPVEVVS
jgi:hypothetical protein